MSIYRNLFWLYLCFLSSFGRNIIKCDETSLPEEFNLESTPETPPANIIDNIDNIQTSNSTDHWKISENSADGTPEPPELPFEYELVEFTQPPDAKQPLILDIEWRFTSPLFEYKKNGDISTYYPAEGYVFRLITQYSKIIWDPHDYSQCSEKVEYNEGNNSVIIHKLDGTSERINLKLLVVNINRRVSSARVTYEKDDWTDTHIFSANPPYLITRVKNGGDVVWQSTSSNFPNRLYLKPAHDDNSILELHYPDNSSDTKLFDYREDLTDTCNVHFKGDVSQMTVRYGVRAVWRSGEIPENGFVSIKKKKNDMLLTSKFTVGVVTMGSKEPNDPTKFYFTKVSETEGHYIFHKGVKCTEIWANGRKIWNHNRKDYGATFPKAISYYGPDEIHVSFSDFLMVLVGDGDDWEPLFYDYHEIVYPENQAADPNQASDPSQQQDPNQQSPDPNQQNPNQPDPNQSPDQQQQKQDPDQQIANQTPDPNQSTDANENEEQEEPEDPNSTENQSSSGTKSTPGSPTSSTHVKISSSSTSNDQSQNENGESNDQEEPS